MITIPDVLTPDHIALDLPAASPEEAILATAQLLRRDPRILDWETFMRIIGEHPPCRVANEAHTGICLPHARTDAVSELVMSASRLAQDLTFPGCGTPVRYLFCLGVPQTMAADYLRVAGALMRILNNAEAETDLHQATSRARFVEILGTLEMKL